MEAVDLDTGKLGRLLEVGRGLVAERDPDTVLLRVLNEARELTGARYAALGILDEGRAELARFLTVGIDDELRRRIGPLPRGHGILGELIREPRPLRLARIGDHPRSYGFPAEHPPMETFLGVPVMIRGEVYGNLYLTEKDGGAEFDEADEHALVVLAEWAAVAIDNARAHDSSRRNQERLERAKRGLEATVSLNREVIGRADLDRVTELVVKRARALAEARTAILALTDGEDFKVAAVAGEAATELLGRDVPAEGTISIGVLRSGRGQLVPADAAARFLAGDTNETGGIAVPLRSRGVDVGVLSVFDRMERDEPFGADDVATLEAFGASAATVIAAAQALEDERLRLSIASSERERQRWARELHDETLQELGALNVMQEGALQVDRPESMREALERSNDQVGQIIDGLLGLITELRPAALDQLGTGAALEVLVDRVRARSGLDVTMDADLAFEQGRTPTRHTPELEATIYRLVQEALANVVKHAGATSARIRLEEDESSVQVTVEDDGSGFGLEDEHDGFGLLGMRERVELRGGELEITSAPGQGTRVAARLPAERVAERTPG
jgi:signal transduction histidine kinase